MKRTGLMLAIVVALQVGWIAATVIRTETRLQGTNTVACDNSVEGARSGLANVRCRPAG